MTSGDRGRIVSIDMTEWGHLLAALLGWLYFPFIASMVLIVLWRKREPSAALGWTLAVVFLPVLGLILFFLFGLGTKSRRLTKKIAHRASFTDSFRFPAGLLESGLLAERAPPARTRWGSIGDMVESLEGFPRRAGNRGILYTEGAKAFGDMIEAIDAARDHVHVEYFIFKDDELGQRLIDRLVARARKGVEVRVCLDGMGTMAPRRIFAQLEAVGARGATYLPLVRKHRLVSPNHRNHRKVVICDGETAFFGGLNVGQEYLGRRKGAGRDWYDLHVGIRGPAVWDLQRMFIEDWDFCTGERLHGEAYFPVMPAEGDMTTQIVLGGPDVSPNPIRQTYFAAINAAEKRVIITTPYLVPDMGLRDALVSAALRGVDLRIVTQAPPADHFLTYHCTLSYAKELLQVGARVYAFTPGMMHAKSIVVDGEWAMVGTANLDNRSMFLNYEQMAIFDEPRVAQTLEEELQRLVKRCQPLELSEFTNQPLYVRMLRRGARLLAPIL